jgi:hypothetical protein
MEGEPGSADMVKVDVPGIMTAGIGRRETLAERKSSCAIGARANTATKGSRRRR